MLHSIRGRLILSVVIMAALLGGLIYLSSARLNELDATLKDLQGLENFKAHVLIPQKDMNEFLAKMDSTVMQLELGQAEGAQEAYDETVDAEQDISAEFAELETNGTGKLKEDAAIVHRDWEIATEYLKLHAEKRAKELGLSLVRPATDPTKTVDAHTAEGVDTATVKYASLSFAELAALGEDDATNAVEIADEGIDTLEESTDEVLAAEMANADKTLKSTSQTILFGSIIVLVAIILIGLIVANSVSKPLVALRDGAERIADGDLDYTFTTVADDEVGSVIHSVEKMSAAMKSRIQTLEEVAGVVLVNGEDIYASATAIEPRTAEVESVIEKSQTLKELVGQVLKR